MLIALASILSGCGSLSVSLTFAPDESPVPTEFRSEAGHFSVDVPAPFKETVKTIDNPYLGPIEVHFFLVTPEGGAQYGVAYGDYPQSYFDATDLDTIYKEAVDGDVGATKGSIVSDKAVTIDGHPANEHILTGARGTYRFITIVAGRRLFSVSVIGSEGALAAPEVTRFFDSFHLDSP